MSHPNSQGNGCSLEDCHTNLFALTDLDGIKWRRLSADNGFFLDPLEDPVLQSFTKCVQADVLCVWRRVQRSSDQRVSDQLTCNKELCIFWYGEEPQTLSSLLSPELQEVETGAWDQGGLTYECRTLLFKALHNLIERCLLSQNFVRVGRWFVQPCEAGNNSTFTDKGMHLSIRFSFFLHGESQVCASIDVRQHTPLRRLQPFHIQYAQNGTISGGVNVILAPYGLSGTLTGVTYKDTDMTTQRLLDEWRQFYVIKDCDMREAPEGNRVPPAVEVIVAGVRMRYPSTFVLVTADIENDVMGRQNPNITGHVSQHQLPAPVPLANLPLTPPTSPMMYGSDTAALKGPLPPPEEVPVTLGGITDIRVLSQRIIEKVWEDDSITAGIQPLRSDRHHTSSGCDMPNDDNVAVWDYYDPTAKTSCACNKRKDGKNRPSVSSGQKPGLQNISKHMKGSDKADKTSARHARPSLPFHRRSGLSDPYLPGEADLPIPRIPPPFGSFKGPTPTNNTSLPQLTGKATFEQNMDSPAAPSPLIATTKEPSSMSQTVDPTMPTLSPQPVRPTGTDAPPLTNGETHNSESLTNTDNSNTQQQPPPAPSGDLGYTKPPSASGPPRPAESNHLPSPFQANPSSVNMTNADGVSKTETVSNWLEQHQKHQDSQGIKRPMLPTKNYEDVDDDGASDALYDFDSLHAWLDQPIKRHKFQDSQQDSGKGSRDHSSGLTNGSAGSQISRLSRDAPPTPPTTVHDPFEFSEESSTNMGSFSKRLSLNRSKSGEDNFPRSSFSSKQDEPSSRRSSDSSFGIKDDPDMSPTPEASTAAAPLGTHLLREQDLKPNVTDLDKLFESSDSENGEYDTVCSNILLQFQVPTSPGVVKMEESKSVGTKEGRLGPTDIIGPTPTELSVMYPTPPSMDNQHTTPSPGTGETLPDQTIISDQTISRMDTISFLSEETIKDWSYVYKPPQQAVLPNAPRYAPIELPSCRLHTLSAPSPYKPSWMYQPLPMIDKHQHIPQPSNLSHYPNVSSVEQAGMSSKMDRMGAHMEAPSPFLSTNQRTPMSYELQSPASNASSYLNKNMSSVDNTHTNSQMPEVHSLAVNIMLSDSVLNIYKDHNFDSCTLCVCNMNIKGADMGVYITDKFNEAQYRCTCGFSAIINRKYGARSGLFYEDEVDITDMRDERLEQRKARLLSGELLAKDSEGKLPMDVNEAVLLLLRQQFSSLFPSSTVLHNYYKQRVDLVSQTQEINLLDLQDGCEACYMALEAGRQVMENCSSQKLDDPLQKATCLHKWPFVLEYAVVPSNSQVIVRLLKSLQPLLQDTIQKKSGTMFWESVYTVSGPLTWKDFHLLAGRGAEEASEPQPIPSVIVGYEKEWLSVSPYTFQFWDKLFLEPYAKQRDVAYIVVAPDNDFILAQLLSFFKELSTMYELLKLGRHCPISKILRDGILRVGKKAAQKVADQPVDDWFTFLGNSPVAAKLKLYAQVCRYRLAPYLETKAVDASLFEGATPATSTRSPPKPHPEPSPQPATPQDGQPATPSSEEKGGDSESSSSTQKEAPEPELPEQDGADCPAVVIYMIDPFTYGADWDDLRRLSMIGLLRCYQEILAGLQENVHMQNNIQLQLVPLQAVLDFRETSTMPYLKQLAMSVYTQCRRNLVHTVLGRSLTGFGPASSAEKILKSVQDTMPIFTPPFILAPFRERQLQLSENTEESHVLFCGYCLSEDQRWLLTAVTDDKGELLETCTINIEIPNRNRRKKASARKIGLAKLWDFILDVMSVTTRPWRLVIGRFGKLGHGELKGWAGLLSKKNLVLASKQLRESCNQCNTLATHETPCIVSACLVSMEIHNSIHIMTDSVKAEEKRSSNIPLSTPRDASCTHILVFPTSSTAQPNAGVQPQENFIDIDADLPTDIGDDPIFEDFGDAIHSFDFLYSPVNSPGSPKNNEENGVNMGGEGGRNSPNNPGTARQMSHDPQDDDKPNLLQQPLAMGFYASTAPSGPIPKWFWSSCPHRQNMCPLCFRAALHIHCSTVQQNQEEFTQNTHSRSSHPLDSTFTCDVLRYVLETYNALSWLTMDPQTNERRSCLPAHFMILMQLYHAMDAFV